MKPVTVLGILFWCPCALSQGTTSSPTTMQTLLPTSIGLWCVSEPSRSYSGTQIFDYMDGAGEVYLAYDYRSLIVQRYARQDQQEILVELFDMDLPRNAFGVFSYMLGRGPAVPIGQEGEYRSGLLCFWKGKYFVYVQIDRENEEATAAVLDLGRAIASRIQEEGERPAIINSLPGGEYLPTTVRYFFRHEILNSHYFVAESNLLLLDRTSEAVLARLTEGQSYVLLVGYASDERADSAQKGFLSGYLHGATGAGPVQRDSGKWSACLRDRHYLAIAFDAATAQHAAAILENVKRRLP